MVIIVLMVRISETVQCKRMVDRTQANDSHKRGDFKLQVFSLNSIISWGRLSDFLQILESGILGL